MELGNSQPENLDGSVTHDLECARMGESYAQLQLWKRYVGRLVRLAKANLTGPGHTVADPEDVALVVFNDLLTGLEEGRFQRLNDRDDLWQILIMLTHRESIDKRRRANAKKRQGELNAMSLQEPLSMDDGRDRFQQQLSASDPTPEEAALLNEQFSRRLDQLDDPKLKSIALDKMSGHENREIAERLGISLRSVERKLSLIRRQWNEQS